MYAGNAYIFPESLSSIQSWWMMMAAGGIVIILATLGTAWQWFGLLAASFLMGISSQLGLTQPLWFQYIKIIPVDEFSYVLYIAIAVQAIMALWVLVSYKVLSKVY